MLLRENDRLFYAIVLSMGVLQIGGILAVPDIPLAFFTALFFWQYKLGMWALYHRLPQRPGFRRVALSDFMEWTTFLTVGRPILVGSLFFAVPAALLVYFGLRGVLIRSRAGNEKPTG